MNKSESNAGRQIISEPAIYTLSTPFLSHYMNTEVTGLKPKTLLACSDTKDSVMESLLLACYHFFVIINMLFHSQKFYSK